MNQPYTRSTFTQPSQPFEVPLRPQTLEEFIGQQEIKERLGVFLGAALHRKEALGHCLLSGPPGLGKTTLAHIIAKTMQKNCVVTSGPVLEKAADLAGILTSLQPGDVLFIDEIHRLSRQIEEYLYPAMEDFALDLVIDSGPSARSVQVKLNPFTVVGATTRVGLLSGPMRSRFAITCRLDYYTPIVLQEIILRAARILNMVIDPLAALEIAKRARGTPRIANHLLKWVRDFAQMKKFSDIDKSCVKQALEMLAIDDKGLDELDKKILEVIIDHYEGGPVGINTIAVAVGEESHTLEEVYEPYLITQGFLKRTPRGREATALAYEQLGKEKKMEQ